MSRNAAESNLQGKEWIFEAAAKRAPSRRLHPMSDIASALKAEISRLARKELRSETDALRKAAAQHRAHIVALRRRIEDLERQLKRASKARPVATAEAADEGSGLRFRAEGFASHRQRLGLSAREMALLIDASPLSVYKWESGQAKPRTKHLASIAAVRKMGKREAAKRLEELAAS